MAYHYNHNNNNNKNKMATINLGDQLSHIGHLRSNNNTCNVHQLPMANHLMTSNVSYESVDISHCYVTFNVVAASVAVVDGWVSIRIIWPQIKVSIPIILPIGMIRQLCALVDWIPIELVKRWTALYQKKLGWNKFGYAVLCVVHVYTQTFH